MEDETFLDSFIFIEGHDDNDHSNDDEYDAVACLFSFDILSTPERDTEMNSSTACNTYNLVGNEGMHSRDNEFNFDSFLYNESIDDNDNSVDNELDAVESFLLYDSAQMVESNNCIDYHNIGTVFDNETYNEVVKDNLIVNCKSSHNDYNISEDKVLKKREYDKIRYAEIKRKKFSEISSSSNCNIATSQANEEIISMNTISRNNSSQYNQNSHDNTDIIATTEMLKLFKSKKRREYLSNYQRIVRSRLASNLNATDNIDNDQECSGGPLEKGVNSEVATQNNEKYFRVADTLIADQVIEVSSSSSSDIVISNTDETNATLPINANQKSRGDREEIIINNEIATRNYETIFGVADTLNKDKVIEVYSSCSSDISISNTDESCALMNAVPSNNTYTYNQLNHENNFTIATEEIVESNNLQNRREYFRIYRRKQRLRLASSLNTPTNVEVLLSANVDSNDGNILMNEVTTMINSEPTHTINEEVVEENTDQIRKRRRRDQMRIRRARQRVNVDQYPRIEVLFDKKCVYCSCMHLNNARASEMKKCCLQGEFKHKFNLRPLPEEYLNFIFRDIAHISMLSSVYNNVVSMCATGVENYAGGGFENNMVGNHTTRIRGYMYHKMPSASNSTDPSGGLSYMMFDSAGINCHVTHYNEEFGNGGNGKRIFIDIVLAIRDFMVTNNIYARNLRAIGTEAEIIFQTTDDATVSIRGEENYFEVAFVSSNRANGPRVLTSTVDNQIIHADSCTLEPMAYPMLYPFGEDGWGKNNRQGISFLQYIRCRTLMPETDENNIPILNIPSLMDANVLIPTNRFQILRRVAQVYIVDMISRAMDDQLKYVMSHQSTILGGGKRAVTVDHGDMHGGDIGIDEQDDDEHDNDTDDAEHDNDITNVNEANEVTNNFDQFNGNGDEFIPSSIFGSRRYLRNKGLNALTVVSELGPPTLFVTVTCNTEWPEIKSQLLPGQTAFDRDDITCRVFKARLDEFLKRIREGKVFLNDEVVYIMHVIEYQHRGLPHAHIVLKLLNDPRNGTNAEISNYINNLISAEMPELPPEDDGNYLTNKRYQDLVGRHMKHKCSTAVNGCKASQFCDCKRHFPFNVTLCTCIGPDGFPIYRRRSENDKNIVPHNKIALMYWDGHVNVEYATNKRNVLYLYRYLYKGVKKVIIDIESKRSGELKAYLSGRYICSMEATWRFFGYQTYPSPTPKVRVIKVKNEAAINELLKEKKSCDQLVYFNRPGNLSEYKYTDLFRDYVVKADLPASYRRRNTINVDYYELHITPLLKPLYLCKRAQRVKKAITRMEMLYMSAGDIFYLRMILKNCAINSFNDAKSFEGVQFKSYQESALHRGLIVDADNCYQMFLELSVNNDASSLRGQFVIFLINNFSFMRIWNDEYMYNMLTADLRYDQPEPFIVMNRLLEDLQLRLYNSGGRKLTHYGLPHHQLMNTELQRETARLNPTLNAQILQNLLRDEPNNNQQEQIYVDVMNDVDMLMNGQVNESKYHFISGPAGTGKSSLFKKLIAACKSRSLLVKICASTTLVAGFYEGGETSHSCFKYPVVEECDFDQEHPPQCLLDNTQRLEVLQKVKVIFWDEFVNDDRKIFESVIKVYELYNIKCIFVCAGDFRQILPVIKHGNKADVLLSVISSSPLWSKFKKSELTVNMRLLALGSQITENTPLDVRAKIEKEIEYNATIMAIAAGIESRDCRILSSDGDSCKIAVKNVSYFEKNDQGTKDCLSWIFPNDEFDQEVAMNTCILAATNASGDIWNDRIQTLNPNNCKSYNSHDFICDVDDDKNIISSMLTEELLNEISYSGVPSHNLNLKVGDICIILRALSALNLPTNMRVQVVELFEHSVRVNTIETTPRNLIIPRMKFKFPIRILDSFDMIRTQLPLRLAYCLTYNKSQGQTLRNVLVDTTEEPFAHGHAYVALSRVRTCENIRLYVNSDAVESIDGVNTPTFVNVVYKEVFK